MILGLGKLPDRSERKLTIAVSAELSADLDAYARLYSETYGDKETPTTLIPYMLQAFMKRDAGFQKARKKKTAAALKTPPEKQTAASSTHQQPED